MNTVVDENTIVCIITDHGAIPAWRMINVPSAFIRSGLTTYNWNDTEKTFVRHHCNVILSNNIWML